MQATHDWLGHGVEKLIDKLGRKTPLPDCDFDVVVVGSGYGGAVAASRFARAHDSQGKPLKICVLERGKEFRPGDFPKRVSDLPGEVRFARHKDDTITGEALGLFDFHLNEHVNVLVGNGLGGGSLINAGVAERVRDDIWDAAEWPEKLRDERATFARYYLRAEAMLDVKRMPAALWPAKTRQMKHLGAAIDLQMHAGVEEEAEVGKAAPSFRPVNVAIHYENQVDADGKEHKKLNSYGIEQQACLQCGDCFTGCNFGAKNTLATNYLPDARRFGAEIYTGATVSFVEPVEVRQEKFWRIWFVVTDTKNAPSRQVSYFILARHVVLAAGTLGSSEILLRSQRPGLKLSPALGTRFSANGDMIWAGHRQRHRVHPSAPESTPYAQRKVGPTITSMVDLRGAGRPGMVIQDAAIPASMYRLFSELTTTTSLMYRMAQYSCKTDAGKVDPDAVDPEHIEHTAVYLTMGRDAAAGRIEYIGHTERNDGLHGRIRIVWKEAAKDRLYAATEATLQSAVDQLGGTLLANPLYRAFPQQLSDALSGAKPSGTVLTVHPLGACPMADSFEKGVVNDTGAVYDGASAISVHQGLYVLDGSIVPTSLGINPLLTITALAERAVQLTAERLGWHIDYAAKIPAQTPDTMTACAIPPIAEVPEPQATVLTFTEVMKGKLSANPDWTDLIKGDAQTLSVDFKFERHPSGFLQERQRRMPISALLDLGGGNTCELEGNVYWLNEVPHHPIVKTLRGLSAYLQLRSISDLFSRIKELGWQQAVLSLTSDSSAIFKLASHVGTERELRYELWPKQVQSHPASWKKDWRLVGIKRVEYATENNLWRSLSDLHVEVIDTAKEWNMFAYGTVSLDWRSMFEQRSLQIDSCENNPYAWQDLVSMGAFFFRAIFRIHFWSFRKPDYQDAVRTFPLPGPLEHVTAPAWHLVTVNTEQAGSIGRPVQIGLTHYLCANSSKRRVDLPPVVMIHGFGASGLQFATPQLDENLVQYFCKHGREVWVLELRTSISLPTSHDQWNMDEVARQDIPAALRYVLQQYPKEQCTQLDVLAHCIGSAMFNIATLSGCLQGVGGKSMVRAAVMLQVGPIFTVSRSNRLRGAAATFIGDALKVDFVDSSTDTASAEWGNVLIDRLLATYPLPKSEETFVRPQRWFQVRTDLANYFRSTGVFSRLFQQEKVSDRIRNSLGDLLGRTNLKTYRQIIHAVNCQRLVDCYGRSVYVTDCNIRNHYRFPALFLHGQYNDVFSSQGMRESKERLARIFPGRAFRFGRIKGYGHLDPLVGEHANTDVYPRILRFLTKPPPFPDTASVPDLSNDVQMVPEIGPVIGWTRNESTSRFGSVEKRPVVRVWIKANEQRNPPVWVDTLLLDASGAYVNDSYRAYPILNFSQFKIAVCDIVLPDARSPFSMLICTTHRGFDTRTECGGTDMQRGLSGNSHVRVMRNTGYKIEDDDPPIPEPSFAGIMHLCEEPSHFHGTEMYCEPLELLPGSSAISSALAQAALPLQCANDARGLALVRAYAQGESDPDSSPFACITLAPAALAAVRAMPDQEQWPALTFALGSCRYSGTPLEIDRADLPFKELYDCVLNETSSRQAAFVLMMGDQIYADATAGIFESHNRLESFADRYRIAFSSTYASKLFATLPSYMMLDDHEISDDWDRSEEIIARDDAEWSRIAETAFTAYQWSHSPRNACADTGANDDQLARRYWYDFTSGGFPFFVMDTRLERDRRPGPGESVRGTPLVSPTQMHELGMWLRRSQEEYGDRPKFVVSPSALAPFSIDQSREWSFSSRSDGWHAYPESVKQLIDLLVDGKIENVVFLSGDLHGSFASRLTFTKNNVDQVVAHALVFSPLYAPYPFANLRSADFLRSHNRPVFTTTRSYRFAYKVLWQDDSYQGFGLLQVLKKRGRWRIDISSPAQRLTPVSIML